MAYLHIERLKLMRKALGKSQREVSALVGVRPSFYSDIENGRRPLTKKFIDKLSTALNVSADWLSEGKGRMLLISDEDLKSHRQSLKNSLENQKIIAEKFFNNLPIESPNYHKFRRAIFAIQRFQDVLDNLVYSNRLNTLTKIDDSSREHLGTTYSEFRDALMADFRAIEQYSRAFENLADAMDSFVDQMLKINDDIIGADRAEFMLYKDSRLY